MTMQLQLRSSANLINAGNVPTFQSQPTGATVSIAGTVGPTPGDFVASVAGTDLNLSQITGPPINGMPGYVLMVNKDPVNYVQWGIWDPSISKFFPVGDLLPGDPPIQFRLAHDFGIDYPGTGSSTGDTNITLRFKGRGGPCLVNVSVFQL